MRKILIHNGDCFDGLDYLGVIKKWYNGTLTIKGRGVEIKATFGSISPEGKFVTFCTDGKCESNCKKRGCSNCRFNKHLTKNKGYYIDK